MLFLQDIQFALRTLAKSPAFLVVAILSLALGIGANTAIFTLTDQVLIRSLPVKSPEQLVMLSAVGRHYGSNQRRNRISYPMYQDFRDHNKCLHWNVLLSRGRVQSQLPGTHGTGLR